MKSTLLLCLLFIVASSHPILRRRREIRGLYSTEDDVEILTSDNFRGIVHNSPTAWFVEFYVSWCGDCQRFAPSWKAFAKNVTGWSDLVKIAVVECSLPLNTPLCRKFQVGRYPTLRYFHENYKEGPDNLGVKIDESDETVEGHLSKLISRIRKDQSKGKATIYPNLLPFNQTTIEKIYETASNNSKFAFITLEDVEGPYIGAQLALDLHKTDQIIIRSVFKNETELLKNMKIDPDKPPSVVVLNLKQKTQEVLSQDATTRDAIKDVIKSYLKSQNIETVEYIKPKKEVTAADQKSVETAKKQETVRGALREHIKKMGDVVFQVDLEAALRHSLKYEVPVTESISGEKLDALKRFIKVLEKYFPFGKHGKKFLSDLSATVSQGAEINGTLIADAVIKAEKSGQVFSSKHHQFLACEGSSKRYRGYPCSLWKLFHFLTVNADQDNFDNEVLTAMHGYIKNFFGCRGCSEHFQEMAKRRNIWGVSSGDWAILWLWAAHNEVNERLSGDYTEDPEYKKYQFPSVERCPECIDYNDKHFIKQEVLNYLKSVYSRYSLNYLGSDSTILFEGLNSDEVGSDKNETITNNNNNNNNNNNDLNHAMKAA